MYAGSVSGKQEQSIAGMKLQTVVLSESRVSQDMHFEPWDPDPEPIHSYAAGVLQCIACFTPEGGMAVTEQCEYQCFFHCLVLITPDADPDIGSESNMQINARFRARYFAEKRVSEEELLAFAENTAWPQVEACFFRFVEMICQYAGLSTAVKLSRKPCLMHENQHSLVLWDDVIDLPPL